MAISPPLLRLENISLTFGGKPLIENASFSVHAGDRIALIGRNGSGKSTLLKIAAGIIEASSGEVTSDRSATIRYLDQSPDMSGFETIGDYVSQGLGPMDSQHRVSYLAQELGLDETRSPQGLSGGEARRAALASVLAPQPDILLLDEPTNHLDLPAIEWLEDELKRSKSALVLISHDRRFLSNITRKTLWLDRGRLREHGQGFSKFEDWRDKLLEEEELEYHKLGRKIVREEHWITHGVSGRRKRNMRRLGELNQLKAEFRDHQRPDGVAKLQTSDGRSSGKMVIEAQGLSISFPGKTLVRDFSLRIHRGDCIGFVGPNGVGKTTLINMLIGHLQPDEGKLRHGFNLDIAILDQRRDALNPDETLEHFLTDGSGQSLMVNGKSRHVSSYMKDFLFKPEQARTPVRELSGGEKARLLLAKLLARSNNVLVLDEPTNDLDMETLDLLQEMIADFDGTVLLVSHDRDFLDRTVNAIIAPEVANPGRWIAHAGGYSDMKSQQGQAERPKTSDAKSIKSQAPGSQKPKSVSSKSKLSYKQKYALETLPGKLEEAALEIASLENKLADSDLFSKDPASFSEIAQQLKRVQDDHAQMEEQWLELEMLREELEGSS